MASVAKTLLTATTSAANSSSFGIEQKGQAVTVQCIGLAGSEKAYLEIYDSIAADYTACYIDGSQPYCDSANNIIMVEVPGVYRIAKDSSVAAVGVAIDIVNQ